MDDIWDKLTIDFWNVIFFLVVWSRSMVFWIWNRKLVSSRKRLFQFVCFKRYFIVICIDYPFHSHSNIRLFFSRLRQLDIHNEERTKSRTNIIIYYYQSEWPCQFVVAAIVSNRYLQSHTHKKQFPWTVNEQTIGTTNEKNNHIRHIFLMNVKHV